MGSFVGASKPGSAPHRTGVGATQEDNMKSLSVASGLFIAGVLSAGLVHAATATVTCKDGTSATGGRGACRGHGGVDKSATAGSAKSEPTAAEEPAGAIATVTCKDGARSKAGRGACRGHGGVDKSAETGSAKSARAIPEEPAGTTATVTCKDGASSKAGRGSCRGHGGIAKSETGE